MIGSDMLHSAPDINSDSAADAGVSMESTLAECAERAIRRYLDDLDGTQCNDLHRLMMQQVEIPLLREVLAHCDGNLSQAAQILGINRATLRKRLNDYQLNN